MLKGPKILPSQQLGAAVAPWPGATGLIASVTADDMAHKGKSMSRHAIKKFRLEKFRCRSICTQEIALYMYERRWTMDVEIMCSIVRIVSSVKLPIDSGLFYTHITQYCNSFSI